MNLTINKLANHYLVLGLGTLIPAIALLLILRSSHALLLEHGKQTIIVLLAQLTCGIVWTIDGVRRRLRTIEILEQASPLCRDLAPNAPPPQSQGFPYEAWEIKRMLETRTTPIYPSEGLSDRLLHHWFPKVMSCSPYLQDQARATFLRVFTATVTLFLFLLALFSAFLGLFLNRENSVVEWTALISFYVLFTNGAIPERWLNAPERQKKPAQVGAAKPISGSKLNPKKLAASITAIIFLPVAISSALGTTLPPINHWIFICFAICVMLPAFHFWAFFSLLGARLKPLERSSQTTSRGMRLQGTIIPEAIYQHFLAAFKREANSTYHCYEEEPFRSIPEPADRVGAVSKKALLESAPLFRTTVPVGVDTWGWAGVACGLAGFVLMCASVNPAALKLNLSLAALSMIIYGERTLRTCEMFSAECLFASTITYFRLEGSFNAVRSISACVGTKSAKTREDTPNLDASIKVTTATLVSSVFAKPGRALPFEGRQRYVLGFDKDEELADAVFATTAADISKQNTLGEIQTVHTGPALAKSQINAIQQTANSGKRLESPDAG